MKYLNLLLHVIGYFEFLVAVNLLIFGLGSNMVSLSFNPKKRRSYFKCRHFFVGAFGQPLLSLNLVRLLTRYFFLSRYWLHIICQAHSTIRYVKSGADFSVFGFTGGFYTRGEIV